MNWDKTGLLNRHRRIEGQVRGIACMIEQYRTCVDMLTIVKLPSNCEVGRRCPA